MKTIYTIYNLIQELVLGVVIVSIHLISFLVIHKASCWFISFVKISITRLGILESQVLSKSWIETGVHSIISKLTHSNPVRITPLFSIQVLLSTWHSKMSFCHSRLLLSTLETEDRSNPDRNLYVQDKIGSAQVLLALTLDSSLTIDINYHDNRLCVSPL